MYHAQAKQSWMIGETVNVGFVRNLKVLNKVATPGDYRPDFYALWQEATNRFYAFQPHHGGLVRCNTLNQAMKAF